MVGEVAQRYVAWNELIVAEIVEASEVLIMTLLGGMGTFIGPALGALVLIWLNQQIVSYTQYWPLILGTILVVLLFVFPGGIAGALETAARRLRGGQQVA